MASGSYNADLYRFVGVHIYKEDALKLKERKLTLSKTIRNIVHESLIYDELKEKISLSLIEINQKIQSLESDIARAKLQRENITGNIESLEEKINNYNEMKNEIHRRAEQHELWIRLCKISSIIDDIIITHDFDESTIKIGEYPEIKEMERLNPGWNLTDHIKLKKDILRSLK